MADSSPISDSAHQLAPLRAQAHPFCFVCSASNPMGLAVRYAAALDGSVNGTFRGNCALEGYPGFLHGGVIAALLDGAMTNCLFALSRCCMTVELNVRYHAGVVAADEMQLRAWVESSSHGLYRLGAELTQAGTTKASAVGRFMARHE